MYNNDSWSLDPSSQYHCREWNDGVTVFLEGENSIFLINSFAAYLLNNFNCDQQKTFQELLDLVRIDYPDDPLDSISQLLENTLAGLSQHGILISTRS